MLLSYFAPGRSTLKTEKRTGLRVFVVCAGVQFLGTAATMLSNEIIAARGSRSSSKQL